MNLRQLRFVIAVADELHFGRAAERLGMTQPPLSQGIAALEQELGIAIFKRSKRHVELTAEGRQLLTHIHRIVENADRLPILSRHIATGQVGTMTLGFVSTADYSLLPDVVGSYRRAFPDVQIILREMTSDLQFDAVQAGELDLGLVIPGHAPPRPQLGYLPLLTEPLVAAVPQAWVDSGRIESDGERVALEAIRHHPLIIFPRRSSPAFYDIIMAYLARHNAAPLQGQEAIQMQTIVSLVSAEMGVALVPRSLMRLRRSGTCYLELSDAPQSIETGLIWKEGFASHVASNFIEVAKAWSATQSDAL